MGDKQKMKGAKKMNNQQTLSGCSESEVARWGLLGKTSREVLLGWLWRWQYLQGSCSVFQKYFLKVEVSEGARMTKALMVSALQEEWLESMEWWDVKRKPLFSLSFLLQQIFLSACCTPHILFGVEDILKNKLDKIWSFLVLDCKVLSTKCSQNLDQGPVWEYFCQGH